jgi:hypothetical protein
MIHIGVSVHGILIIRDIIGHIIIQITGADIGMVIPTGIVKNIIVINVTGIVEEAIIEIETVIVHETILIMSMDTLVDHLLR